MDALVKVSFRHTEESIRAMTAMQMKLSGNRQGRAVELFGAAALAVGTVLSIGGQNAALLLVLIGCWAIMAVRQTPGRTAKKIVRALKGKLPEVIYSFRESDFEATFDKTTDVYRYEEVSALVKDRYYLYIYLRSMVVLIIPRTAKNLPAETEGILSDRTEKQWISRVHSFGLFGPNIYNFIRKNKERV